MPAKVLCVDDEAYLLDMYRSMHVQLQKTGHHFELDTAQSPDQAMALIAARGPYAVIISDLHMPGMDGVQLLRWAKEAAPTTVRIMLTGAGTLTAAIEALEEGSIFRFQTKPCGFGDFDRLIAAGIEQHRLIVAEKELLEKTLMGSVEALTGILSIANPTAFGRAARIRHLVKRLGEVLHAGNLWQLEIAAMLSQAGCVTVPQHILRRAYRGAELHPDEQELYAKHPHVGHDLVAHIPRLEAVAYAIAYQDKHFDGTGLPADNAKGNDLPLAARILKVALDWDILEAKGLAEKERLDCLRERHGWYDPRVLAALESISESKAGEVLKEVTVDALIRKLDAVLNTSHVLDKVQVKQMVGHMILADNVWTHKDVLVLSKGHELTLPLLERLRRYSRHAMIREPIRVWMPANGCMKASQ